MKLCNISSLLFCLRGRYGFLLGFVRGRNGLCLNDRCTLLVIYLLEPIVNLISNEHWNTLIVCTSLLNLLQKHCEFSLLLGAQLWGVEGVVLYLILLLLLGFLLLVVQRLH